LVCFSLASTAGGQSAPQRNREIAQQIDVVANDYAFGPLPSHIGSGPTVFTFANHGSVQHEASIARLKAGQTVDDYLKLLKEGGRPRDVVERSVGILIAGPTKSPDGKLWVELIRGESYVLICTLRDRPGAPAHAMLGMYAAFKPE
jgi:hypothetical protein